MFEFAENLKKRKAMKRALFEIELEDALNKQQASGVTPVREYRTNQEIDQPTKTKVGGALKKPQTEAVDLKNFKDWRNINNKPNASEPKKRSFVFDDDDEGYQPQIEGPLPTQKRNLLSSIADISKPEDNTKKGNDSISDFFKEKYSSSEGPNKTQNFTTIKSDENVVPNVPKVEEQKVEQKQSVKISLNDLLKRKKSELEKVEIADKVDSSVDNKENKDNTVKIEIIDFNENKKENVDKKVSEPQKPKKTINRKPRGKNKRRFDADVISSVDWK